MATFLKIIEYHIKEVFKNKIVQQILNQIFSIKNSASRERHLCGRHLKIKISTFFQFH